MERRARARYYHFGHRIAQHYGIVFNGEMNKDIEQIQAIVEEVLISSPYKKTAKAYIIYREQHARIREIAAKAGVDSAGRLRLEGPPFEKDLSQNILVSLQRPGVVKEKFTLK